jgi:hypothetical protein
MKWMSAEFYFRYPISMNEVFKEKYDIYRMSRSILILSSLLIAVNCIAQSTNCDLKKDKDSIKVYTCKSDTSKFRSLRAEFVIENVSLEELKTFMFTVSDYLKWQYDAIEASILKQINTNEMIYRVVIDAPWPVDNREMIVHFSTVLHDADHANFYINTVPSDFPKNEDLVRIPYSQARWDIVRVNQSLHVTYSMNIDPGGYVPPFLINMAMADGPYKSFKSLKSLLEKK